jgi:hypothetical protein
MPAALRKAALRRRPDDEILAAGRRAQPGKLGDDILFADAGHQLPNGGKDGLRAVRAGAQVVAVGCVVRRGADHQRAVVGGNNQDAFRHRRRAGEDHMLDQPLQPFVEQIFLTLARLNGEGAHAASPAISSAYSPAALMTKRLVRRTLGVMTSQPPSRPEIILPQTLGDIRHPPRKTTV